MVIYCAIWRGTGRRLTRMSVWCTRPPNTIAAVLTAVNAAEAEKHSKVTKLVVSEVYEQDNKVTSQDKTIKHEILAMEQLQEQMKEVRAISRQQYGGQTAQKSVFANYKCYKCKTMGHIRSQCRIPVQSVQPNRRQGRGRGNRRFTRRGQYALIIVLSSKGCLLYTSPSPRD